MITVQKPGFIARILITFITVTLVILGFFFLTVALAVGRGLLAASDCVWFTSRGVVAEELARGEMVEIPTGVRFLSGAVGITRLQSAQTDSGTDLLLRLCREETLG